MKTNIKGAKKWDGPEGGNVTVHLLASDADVGRTLESYYYYGQQDCGFYAANMASGLSWRALSKLSKSACFV